MIDDDQLYEKYWVENMWNLREPMTYKDGMVNIGKKI